MSSEGKVVQTRLDPGEYERLKQVADQAEKPLKEVLREAAMAYADAHSKPDPADPLFAAEPPAGNGTPVSAARTDEYLYGDQSE